jgi:hypothetical protein
MPAINQILPNVCYRYYFKLTFAFNVGITLFAFPFLSAPGQENYFYCYCYYSFFSILSLSDVDDDDNEDDAN